MSKREEDKLRETIYKHYHDNNIDDANRLVGTFQEFAPAQIRIKRPLGLTPGLSDFLFFGDYATGYIEVKYPNSTHDLKHVKRQAELMVWYQNNVKTGARGYFVTTLEAALYCIDQCSGFVYAPNVEGLETAQAVFFRILQLEKEGKKSIRF